MKRQFVFLNPGHFHAALVLRASSVRIDNKVHVFSPPGLELDAFTNLVNAFNMRAENPCQWQLVHHDGDLDALLSARLGDVAVLAGVNKTKLNAIARLARAGYHVLADKPWLTDPHQLPDLTQALSASSVVMDIMTIRHEILSRLCHVVVTTPAVFGGYCDSSPQQPAIQVGSVHHLFKRVNGQPLKRPTWYYDAQSQGDGLVDIQSHMVEQALWFVLDDAIVKPESVQFVSARRWATPVSQALFRKSTGAEQFPDEIATGVDSKGVLQYPSNGEISWMLDGVHIRQRAQWRAEEPAGGGDLHEVQLRGNLATVNVEQGEHTRYAAQVHISPGPDSDTSALKRNVDQAMTQWQARFPQLRVVESDKGLMFVAPAVLDDGHESHFPLVRDQFLDAIEAGSASAAVLSRMRTRYHLIAQAKQSVDNEPGSASQ